MESPMQIFIQITGLHTFQKRILCDLMVQPRICNSIDNKKLCHLDCPRILKLSECPEYIRSGHSNDSLRITQNYQAIVFIL